MQIQWWGYHEVVGTLKYAKECDFSHSQVVGTQKLWPWVLTPKSHNCWTFTFNYYRPQRSCGQGCFYSCLWFCSRGGGWGSASVHAGIPPPWKQAPPAREANTTPREARPPEAGTPPEIRSVTGRYASYWNAFLFHNGCPFINVTAALIYLTWKLCFTKSTLLFWQKYAHTLCTVA